MATTASFSGAYGHNIQMDLKYGTVSQDIANNSSRIRVWIVLRSNVYGALYNITAPLTLNVDGGGAIENVTINLGTNASSTIFSKEYTVTHDGTGTKTVSLSASLAINTAGYGTASTSASYTLATIASVSDVSVGEATTGGTLAITISKKNDSARHTIRYGFGTMSGTIATGIDTSYTWSVPASLASQMPNTTSSKGTIWVDTYFGSTMVGTSAAVFDITVPATVRPSLSGISLTDGNTKARSLFTDASTYVQEISNIQVTFNGANGIHGSSIAQYEATIVGKNNRTTEDGGHLGTMPYSGTAIVRARVQDSRGRWSDTKEVSVNILPYHTPRLSFTAVRGDIDGSRITIKRQAIVAPLTVGTEQKNSMQLTFSVAKGNSTAFVNDTGPAAGSWSTQSAITSEALLAGTYTTDSAWIIESTLTDEFTNAKFRVVVPTADVVYAYDKQGRVGVGTVPDRGKAGSINVAGDIYVGGALLLDIFYPVGTIYESTASANPSTLMGGTWERFGNGRVLVGVDENDSDFNTPNKTGGEKKHTLTIAEMPSHTHTFSGANPHNFVKVESSSTNGLSASAKTTDAVGGNQAHNNLQPYITVYMWRRTA